jgi:transcriptional regulator with XRE-family HTH domain
MKEKGLSVYDLANATAVGYERARTAVTGVCPPSVRLLGEICRVLNLDLASATDMLIDEQMKRKFGRIPVALARKDPELQQIEEVWQLLTPEEKEHITWLVNRYAEKKSRKPQVATPFQRIAPRPVRTP